MSRNVSIASARGQKARTALLLQRKPIKIGLKTAVILGVILTVLGLMGESLLWGIPAALALAALMVLLWNKGELQQLDGLTVNTKTAQPDEMLTSEVLGRLRQNEPSTYDVWVAAKQAPLYYFFQNRYMLHPYLFEEHLNKDKNSAAKLWEIAEGLRQKYGMPNYSMGIVVVALLRSIKGIEDMLRREQLELSEIETGITWLRDLEQKIALAQESRLFGGLARDWAYGYTPLLRHLGLNVSEQIEYQGFFRDTQMHEDVVSKMAQSFTSGNNVIALIGDVGVGKTTCVYAFAERLLQEQSVDRSLRYNQVVALSATSLLSEVRAPGQLESLVTSILVEAKRAKNIILFFDDAHVFFSSGTGATDLTNVLQPVIESGAVRLVFSMTPRDWQELSNKRAAIVSKVQPLTVQPADEAATLHVLQDHVLELEHGRKVVFTYQSLREAYRLGGRYVDSQAMPGAALQILEQATTHIPEGLVTAESIKQTIEASMGVKLQTAQQDESKKLLSLEDDLHKYVINQKQAVGVIANALRRSRSGVGNPDRPIGTFLFLGPTGVGKTELSKALARVYFNDVDALIRVDMNQFVSPDDVAKLTAPMSGNNLGFIGQVRKRPFSVILLDEIEKAHPQVINALLQMLDEGTMQDSQNKKVSFKDAIVIATSNAGADEIRRLIDEGEDLAGHEDTFIDHIINKGIFAPEFVNRFDEVVLFRPLNQDELVQVVDLIIAGINKTLDAKKLKVTLTDAAKRWLVEKGYDSRLGARPMRRMAQRYVENIIAKRILGNAATPGSEIKLDVSDFEQSEQS